MVNYVFGLPIDIHTGGVDLKFPHHEDDIAQCLGGYKVEPAHYWCHNEFVEVEGAKMSKSSGNFLTLRGLEKDGIEPLDIRFAVLSAHYKTKYNFTIKGISDARKAKSKIQSYIADCLYKISEEGLNKSEDGFITSDLVCKLKENIFAELANDLHTPKALAHLFTFVNNNSVSALNMDDIRSFINLMRDLNDIFGVWKFEILLAKTENDIPKDIIELAEQRLAAKKSKDFSTADKLRNEITILGYNILDTKEGFTISKTSV
jgi:cysteinyl-tRNA synthetase